MKKQVAVSIQDMEQNCEVVAGVMKALAHPQRLLLLCHLSSGEKTVGELERLCSVSQSAMSQFLNRMKLEKMVDSEKRGQHVYYKITDPQVKKLIVSLHTIFC